MSTPLFQQMHADCRTIWGSHYDFDFELENDDYEEYQYFVRKDYGDRMGDPLLMTLLCRGEREAEAELAKMLRGMAKEVKSGRPMTTEQRVGLFSGPKGEFKTVISMFADELDAKRGEVNTTK